MEIKKENSPAFISAFERHVKELKEKLEPRNISIREDFATNKFTLTELGKKYNLSHESIRLIVGPKVSTDRIRKRIELNKKKTEEQKLINSVFAVLKQFITWGNHGTNQYRLGCRCDVCRKANADRARELRNRTPEKKIAYNKTASKWQKNNPQKVKQYHKRWLKKKLKKGK